METTAVSDADREIARIARDLAEALSARARERTVACNLRVAELQTELCAVWRREMQARFAEKFAETIMPHDEAG